MFYVHSFHPKAALFFLKLVIHDLFEAHSLKAEHTHKAIIIATIRQNMITVHSIVVNVQFMEDHVTRGANFQAQVHRNILESQMAA